MDRLLSFPLYPPRPITGCMDPLSRLLLLIELYTQGNIQKAKKYLKHGQVPPRGYQVHYGPKKGIYYNTKSKITDNNPDKPKKVQVFKITSPDIRPIESIEFAIDCNRLHQALSSRFFQFRRDLSPSEKKALLAYQEDSSGINTMMRNRFVSPLEPKVEEEIRQIKSAFNRSGSNTPKDMLLFRGISVDYASTIITGGTFLEPSFTSASFDPRVAILYGHTNDRSLGVRDSRGYVNVLTYTFPGGKGIYMGHHSEILLPQEITWNIQTIREIDRMALLNLPFRTPKLFRRIRLIQITPIKGGEDENR